MQSTGAKILSSRMYGSFVVKSTQMLPAMPVRMTRRRRRAASRGIKRCGKEPRVFGLQDEVSRDRFYLFNV